MLTLFVFHDKYDIHKIVQDYISAETIVLFLIIILVIHHIEDYIL